MDIKNLTEEHLFAIINIATGGYFNGKWSKDKKEVEVGGYDKRRRVIWIQNTEGYDEYHAFEITSEYGPWSWICEVSLKKTDWERESYWIINGAKSYKVNCVNPSGVIDYCDKNNIDVRNNGASIVDVSSSLSERSKKIELLEAYSKFLQKGGYMDTDWKDEEPFAIDVFLGDDKT